MYGKAIKCDVCDKVEIINDFDHGTTFFDAGFRGWARITVNEPRDYGWRHSEARHATTVDSIDACSIDCAQKFLRDCSRTIPIVSTEVSA